MVPAAASTRPRPAGGVTLAVARISQVTTNLSKLTLLFVLAATFFLYSVAVRFPFVYDDVFQIVQNQHLESWKFLPTYFTEHVWSHVPGVPANFYRPLFLIWLRLNYLIFGHEASGWHLTTILAHLLATALAYLLAFRILKNRPAAFFARRSLAFIRRMSSQSPGFPVSLNR